MKGKFTNILCLLVNIVTIANGFSCHGATGIVGPDINSGRKSLSSIVVRSSADENEETSIATSDVVKKVAVTGATGKTGMLVVEELIKRNVQVLGLVRNETKAAERFGGYSSDTLEIQKCDLADPEAIGRALAGCDATIWCATGFSDDPATGQMPPTATMSPEQSIDVTGIPAVAHSMIKNCGPKTQQKGYPKVVMLSR